MGRWMNPPPFTQTGRCRANWPNEPTKPPHLDAAHGFGDRNVTRRPVVEALVPSAPAAVRKLGGGPVQREAAASAREVACAGKELIVLRREGLECRLVGTPPAQAERQGGTDLASAGGLRALLTQNAELLRTQLLPPLRVRLADCWHLRPRR